MSERQSFQKYKIATFLLVLPMVINSPPIRAYVLVTFALLYEQDLSYNPPGQFSLWEEIEVAYTRIITQTL
jgi:hypothetical protein